jgi:hypothetical protein
MRDGDHAGGPDAGEGGADVDGWADAALIVRPTEYVNGYEK